MTTYKTARISKPVRVRDRAWVGGVALALLVFSGQVKETVLFSWLPVDLTIAAAAVTALALVVDLGRHGLPSGRVWIAVALFALFALPLAVAPVAEQGVEKVQLLFTVTLLIAVAPFVLLRRRMQVRGFLVATVMLGLIAAYVVWTSRTTSTGFDSRFYLEGADTIGTARLAASAAMVCLLIAFSASLTKPRRLLLFVAGIALLTVAFASGSRGPVLGALLALFVLVIVAPQFKRRRLLVLVLSIAGALITAWVAAQQAGDAFARIAAFVDGQADDSTVARELLTREAWRLIEINPAGIGWGNFYFGGGLFSYPHNTYLEVAVEAGWFIGLIFAGLCVVAAIRYLRLPQSPEWLVMFGLFVFAALNAAVSSNLTGNRLLIVTLFAALALPLAERRDRSTRTPPRLPSLPTGTH